MTTLTAALTGWCDFPAGANIELALHTLSDERLALVRAIWLEYHGIRLPHTPSGTRTSGQATDAQSSCAEIHASLDLAQIPSQSFAEHELPSLVDILGLDSNSWRDDIKFDLRQAFESLSGPSCRRLMVLSADIVIANDPRANSYPQTLLNLAMIRASGIGQQNPDDFARKVISESEAVLKLLKVAENALTLLWDLQENSVLDKYFAQHGELAHAGQLPKWWVSDPWTLEMKFCGSALLDDVRRAVGHYRWYTKQLEDEKAKGTSQHSRTRRTRKKAQTATREQ